MELNRPPTSVEGHVSVAEETAFPQHEEAEDEKLRFLLDLEFLQALANPEYLKFIAQDERKFLDQAEFIEYLKYLRYWHRPEYVKYITYPHALQVLDLLQDEVFRKSLPSNEALNLFAHQQQLHWQYYRRNRAPGTAADPNPDLNRPSE